MKKIFLLIPMLAFALMANAKEIEVASGTSNIIHFTIANSNTEDGDVLVLTDAGPYVSTKSLSDDYTKLSKNVTIKAADGITPVVRLQVPIQGRNGKSAKFIGIKFDCGDLQYSNFIHFNDDLDNGLEFEDCEFYNSSQYLVRVSSGKKVESLKFKNCKFYNNSSTRGILNEGTIGHLELDGCEVSGFAKEFIHGYSGSSHVDECIINDCYFHDNSRSSILFVASTVEGQQTCDELTVTNSTFANINATGEYEGVVEARPYGSANTDAIKVVVDHCTFYNNTTIDGSYSNIRTKYLTDVTVSNCIFAHSEEYARRATYCTGGGNINNCLTYNYTAEGTKGHAYGATVNAASVVAAPLFNDLANNKYTVAGNWVTMNISPARAAATDGSDLGDPRWYSDEILPDVDFATPYVLDGLHAKLNGRIALDGDNYLKQNNNGDASLHGTATWKLHATKAGYVSVTPNIKGGSGHHYQIAIFDANNNTICDPLAESDSWDGDITPNFGTILIPAAGDYKVVLSNLMNHSGATLRNITLAYVGGAVQTIPGTTDINEAWFSANGTRADGKISYSDVENGCWAKWNINVTAAGSYNVTVNISGQWGHNYSVEFLKEGETTPIVVTKGATNYDNDATLYANELGSVTLEAANYEMKVYNNVGDAALHSVKLDYAGGAVITLPGTLPLMEAVLSPLAYKEPGTGYIHFTDDAHVSQVPDQLVKWNIQAATGYYTFTFDVLSPNYGKYVITIRDDEDNVVYTDEYDKEGNGSFTTEKIILMDGNYTVHMQNLQGHSKGYITNMYATADNTIFIVDENATDNAYIAAMDGVSKKALIKRTFKGGMYNTICIPVEPGLGELTNVFGDGYELLELESAELDGSTLNLNFINATSFVAGKPYLIKPVNDVTNPIVPQHSIHNYTTNFTVAKTNADFIGSFIKGEVPAGEDNLFLGPNNLLYFSETVTPIKGTRAYFQLKGISHPQQAIKHARIVLHGQTVTAIDFVNEENEGIIKTIENGQLFIIKNGVRYNAMGGMIK